MDNIVFTQFISLIKNTLRREARSRTLLFMGVITILVIVLTNLSFNFMEEFTKSYMDIGDKKLLFLARIINFWAGFMGFYFGLSSLKSDEENGVQPILLSFPISRTLYIFSRLFGAILIVFSYYLGSLIIATMLFALSKTGVNINPGLFLSLFGTLLVITGAAITGLFISLFFGRAVSLVLGFLFLPMISLSNTVLGGLSYKEIFSGVTFLKAIGIFIHTFFPRLGVWSVVTTDLIQESKLNVQLAPEVAHFLGIAILMLWSSIFIFRKRGV